MTLILDFELEYQKGIRLCWSAVATSIEKFYWPNKKEDQIEFATRIHGTVYDKFCDPVKALSKKGLFYSSFERPLNKQEVIEELSQGHPIVACMRQFVGWHLVVIYGLNELGELLIADPATGLSAYMIENFTQTYEKYHHWTHTYKVRPQEIT